MGERKRRRPGAAAGLDPEVPGGGGGVYSLVYQTIPVKSPTISRNERKNPPMNWNNLVMTPDSNASVSDGPLSEFDVIYRLSPFLTASITRVSTPRLASAPGGRKNLLLDDIRFKSPAEYFSSDIILID